MPIFPLNDNKKSPYTKWKDPKNQIKVLNQLDQLKNATGAGLLTGELSGIMVVDLDVKPEDDINGIDIFNKMWPDKPTTLIVQTPNEGYHVYYKYREGLKNKANYFKGIDIRTEGGYIVAPGSSVKKRNGAIAEYKIAFNAPIAEMPEELFQMFRKQDEDKKQQKKPCPGKIGQAKNSQKFEKGERNQKLFHAGLAEFSKSIERNFERIFDRIVSLNDEKCNPPIDDQSELKGIAKSISEYLENSIYDQNDRLIPILLVSSLMKQRPLFVRGNFVYMYDDNQGFYALQKDNDIHKIYIAKCKVTQDAIAGKAKAFNDLLKMAAWDDLLEYQEKDFINCLDGVLNWRTGELFPHDKKYRLISQIQAKWKRDLQDFESSRFKEFLDGILDQESQQTLQEAMGLMISPHAQEAQTSFSFLGNGSNGKSKLMDIMKALVGQQNISSVGFSKFGGEFDLASMEGKILNLVYDDDLTDGSGKIGAAFKSVISGEPINVNRKQKDHQSMQFNITAFFGLNVMPAAREKSHGIFRRIHIIPFSKTFGSQEEVVEGKADSVGDPYITQDILKNELDLIFHWCVEGLIRLEANNFKLTISQASKDEIENYKRDSDSAYQFLQEEIEEVQGYVVSTTSVIYAYECFCGYNGIKPMDGRNFGKRLKALGIKQKRKSDARFYLDIRLRKYPEKSLPYIKDLE